MTLPTKLVLFGDQTVDPCPIIKQLCRQSRESVTLQAFFRKTYNAVRQEIALSEKPDRSLFPSFDSILSLAETYSKSNSPEEAVTTVLLCIAQLGLILIRGENDDSTFEANPSSTTYLVGLCTGMLPAVATAASSTSSQLLHLAPEIVRVSLRLGLEASRRSGQIEKSRESWATVVPGIAPFEQQEALDQFHQTHTMATSKTAYISALSDSTATISGPPSTLASLFSFSGPLKKARRVKLPITAAFHAPHLGTPDIERIIAPLSNSHEHYLRKDVAILSTRSGEPIAARTLGEALQHIVLDILQEPLSWLKVVQNILSNLAGQNVVLTSIGPVRAADGLRQKLTSAGINILESDGLEPLQALQPENRSSDIAIVGYAARLPESETLEDVWKILEDGRDVHKKIPRDRFDVETHCDPSGKIKNTSYTPYGCFVDRPGFFDARLFNMSPREAAQTDPAQRLLLLTTYEALEMAGYTPDGTPSTAGDRIGTFFGQTLDDYREANASQNIEMYYVSGGIRAFGPGRLNYHFKWEGPSYCVDAACSSSTLSIQMAMSSLRTHECDTAVAGGTNVLTGVDMFSGLSRGVSYHLRDHAKRLTMTRMGTAEEME
ncbi:hypothetical protein ABVK25_003166 [Lepraria finkii]|uniref:Ketosynthase family 3 (KS3) domain-containing protein n=1 Tax=Lepraria finkii TaxID=1340010 RepID=A0ABR4BG31_9LECA